MAYRWFGVKAAKLLAVFVEVWVNKCLLHSWVAPGHQIKTLWSDEALDDARQYRDGKV